MHIKVCICYHKLNTVTSFLIMWKILVFATEYMRYLAL